MIKKIIKSLLIASTLVASFSTYAIDWPPNFGDTVSIKRTGTKKGAQLKMNVTGNFIAGETEYVYSVGNTSFYMFDTEINQSSLSPAFGFRNFTIGAFNSTQGPLIQKLFSSSFASIASDLDRAAFQVAVWEFTYETGGSL